MKIHKIICDRCGREKYVEDPYYYTVYGKSWTAIGDKDLCHKCYEEYQKQLEEFIKK